TRYVLEINEARLMILVALFAFLVVVGLVLPERFGSRLESEGTSYDGLTTERLLALEIQYAGQEVMAMKRRSLGMLMAGVTVSLAGLIVFLSLLPDLDSESHAAASLSLGVKSLRSVGLLVFIEAVAWFFLRQYSASIEHGKYYHRIYLRRVSYLVTYKLLSRQGVEETDSMLPVALLQEDLSGHLRASEASEMIEGLKLVEPNPVAQLLGALVHAAKGGGKGQV
ncbi:MAG: hypothetical protein M3O15_09460, partial [Acidobacteriota bacterium]|nr:hypothetical protein [Acidobacteriota bacterium]